jgi:hypothetical protein
VVGVDVRLVSTRWVFLYSTTYNFAVDGLSNASKEDGTVHVLELE